MSFRFEKDATKAGKKNLFWGVFILLVFVALQMFIFNRPDFPIVIVIIGWFIGGIIVLISISHGVSLLMSGGKWEIVIDHEKMLWSSPNESVDKSFDLKLKEIDKIILRHQKAKHPRKSAALHKPDYVLATKSGVEFVLSPNSGVNLQMIFTELERKGIQLVTEHI